MTHKTGEEGIKISMMFNPKWILGKKVASVTMNPFHTGQIRTTHNPVIYFEDGSYIKFETAETEHGVYGTDIRYYKPPKKVNHV